MAPSQLLVVWTLLVGSAASLATPAGETSDPDADVRYTFVADGGTLAGQQDGVNKTVSEPRLSEVVGRLLGASAKVGGGLGRAADAMSPALRLDRLEATVSAHVGAHVAGGNEHHQQQPCPVADRLQRHQERLEQFISGLVLLLPDINSTLGVLVDRLSGSPLSASGPTPADPGVGRTPSSTAPAASPAATTGDSKLELAHERLAGTADPAGGRREPLHACELNPSPVISTAERTTLPACARTCLQLRNQGGQHEDGVYWLSGMDVPVYCDFSHDGGGWTLLLTTASKDGWNGLTVLERNPRSPSLSDNYSILRRADDIKDQGKTIRFVYRIEAKAETGRQHWGGIWLAPRHYTFTSYHLNQTDVVLAKRFDSWGYGPKSIERRMPRIREDNNIFLLTTSAEDGNYYGTLVTSTLTSSSWVYNPWVHGTAASNSGKVLYWLREEEL